MGWEQERSGEKKRKEAMSRDDQRTSGGVNDEGADGPDGTRGGWRAGRRERTVEPSRHIHASTLLLHAYQCVAALQHTPGMRQTTICSSFLTSYLDAPLVWILYLPKRTPEVETTDDGDGQTVSGPGRLGHLRPKDTEARRTCSKQTVFPDVRTTNHSTTRADGRSGIVPQLSRGS